MSVAHRGIDPDTPQPSDNWSHARALAYLEKIKSHLPSWASNATVDLDGDDERVTFSISFHGVPLTDFDYEADTRIGVLNIAMVKS